MTPIDAEKDPIIGALSDLAMHEPGRECTARIRSRSHDTLRGRRWWRHLFPQAAGVVWRRTVEPTVVGVAGAAYLSEVIRMAFRLHSF